ncbi:MAG: hypothetical protein DMF52_05630 [Acidobacteria bacterium]|nr:MAG: hypothetical protein DMF52_05630 [Acidobacteriota bacterium]
MSVSLRERGPSVPVMVTVVVLATGDVAIVTFSTLLPGGMVTLGGTLATCGLLLVITIVGPPDVETALNQIETSELLPPITGSISTDTWPRVGIGWAGGGFGGVIASQVRPNRWLRKVPPPLIGTGISMFAPTEENSMDGRIEVATRKLALVAPVVIGKKPVGKAVVWESPALTIASEPDGAAEARSSVP